MAYYVMEEMPDIHKTGERVLYPRFAMIDQVSTEQLARNVSESSGFNVGDIIGIVKQLAIEMSHQMAEGRSVKLDDIGTFTPALMLRTGKERAGRSGRKSEASQCTEHRGGQSQFPCRYESGVSHQRSLPVGAGTLEDPPFFAKVCSGAALGTGGKVSGVTFFSYRQRISAINRLVAHHCYE